MLCGTMAIPPHNDGEKVSVLPVILRALNCFRPHLLPVLQHCGASHSTSSHRGRQEHRVVGCTVSC